MRLIDADALKERAIRVSTVKEHCYMKAVGTHEIDKAPTVEVGKWIPVTERLPDVDGRYLCFHRGAYANWMQSVQFAKDARKFDEYAFKKQWENKWLLYDSEYGYYAVDSITHWMPLPEPPKEVE